MFALRSVPLRRQRGVSLVELMVAIVLGMLVIAASLALYANTFGVNASALRVARLNNELRAVMTAVTRDLRRAGYNGAASAALANPFGGLTLSASGTQITFTYDLDSNGALGSAEQFGYRFSSASGLIQSTTNGTNWEAVTDPGRIWITGFVVTDDSPAAVSMGSASGTIVNVQVRAYTVTLTGTTTSGGQTFTRVLRETVRVRNEGVS
jgi:prepilin peptidase dependent protein B